MAGPVPSRSWMAANFFGLVSPLKSSPVRSSPDDSIFGAVGGALWVAPVGPSRIFVGSVERMSATITSESPFLMPICGAPVVP